MAVAALVVNRIAPSFGDGEGADAFTAPAVGARGAMAALEANLAELNAVAAREEASFSGLAAKVSPAPVGRIPLFGEDVHELAGLARPPTASSPDPDNTPAPAVYRPRRRSGSVPFRADHPGRQRCTHTPP